MNLLIGTTNKGKYVEMNQALEGLEGIDLQLRMPGDFGITESPVETGNTFEENACQKAIFYADRAPGTAVLADDSGIIVEALKDELGIHTRRWGAGPLATDAEWIAYFLKRMENEQNRDARFTCVLCYIDEVGQSYFFTGECDGTITHELEADFLPGLPISACFKPQGFDRVYSNLSLDEKNAISHRGRALEKFRQFMISPNIKHKY